MAGSLLALSWSYFPEYQKPCHVLLFAHVVHFELDSTMTIEKISAFITSITSIAALLISTYTFVKQTQQAKITLAVNLLRDIEKHFFYSDEMRQKRCVTAKFLLNHQ